MKKIVPFLALFALAGCTKMRSAQPLYPAATSDAPAVWVYVDTAGRRDRHDGIYRCYEGPPVKCVRAEMTR